MAFECKRCGKRFNIQGYSKEGTFYTLCSDCGEAVLKELATGITKVSIQEVKTEKWKRK